MRLLLAIALAAGLAFSAQAQSGPTDKQFVEKTSSLDMLVDQANQQAKSRAKSPDVKGLSEKIGLRTGTDARATFVRLAQESKLEPAAQLESEHAARLDKMSKADVFDTAYIDLQLITLGELASLLEGYGNVGANPKLRDWAQENLPRIREQLTAAKATAETLKTQRS